MHLVTESAFSTRRLNWDYLAMTCLPSLSQHTNSGETTLYITGPRVSQSHSRRGYAFHDIACALTCAPAPFNTWEAWVLVANKDGVHSEVLHSRQKTATTGGKSKMSEVFTNWPLDVWMYQQTQVLTERFKNRCHKKENKIDEIWESKYWFN